MGTWESAGDIGGNNPTTGQGCNCTDSSNARPSTHRLLVASCPKEFPLVDVRFGSIAAPQHDISLTAAFGCIADTHASATFLVIVDDRSASRPDIGFIRLAPHNLSGVVYYETERIGKYVYRGKQ